LGNILGYNDCSAQPPNKRAHKNPASKKALFSLLSIKERRLNLTLLILGAGMIDLHILRIACNLQSERAFFLPTQII
jgi:hypothetical protein